MGLRTVPGEGFQGRLSARSKELDQMARYMGEINDSLINDSWSGDRGQICKACDYRGQRLHYQRQSGKGLPRQTV